MIAIVYESIEPETGPVGRRGWLIVVAGGLVYTVLAIPLAFVRDWVPVFLNPEAWAMLGDPIAYGYHPSLPAFVLFQLLIGALVAFAAFVGLILFAQRSELFPKYMIAYYLGSFVLFLAILIVEEEMWAWDPTSHSRAAGGAAKAFLWAVAGVPYFSRSRRVKNTFVKRPAPAAASPAV